MPAPAPTIGDATRRLNPHLFGTPAQVQSMIADIVAPLKPRIKQKRTPKLNGLETDFLAVLQARNPGVKIHAQSVTILISNGCRYTPDFVAKVAGEMHAWETKGPYAYSGSLEKLKMAASVYPEITFWLVSRDKTAGWRIERVFP